MENSSRRDFLKQASIGAATLAVSASTRARARGKRPNSDRHYRVRFAGIDAHMAASTSTPRNRTSRLRRCATRGGYAAKWPRPKRRNVCKRSAAIVSYRDLVSSRTSMR